MNSPVRPEDLKIVQGNSGKGLQIVCSCGCVNWNHLEMPAAEWSCRNCRRVFTRNFPALVRDFLALQKQGEAVPTSSPAS